MQAITDKKSNQADTSARVAVAELDRRLSAGDHIADPADFIVREMQQSGQSLSKRDAR